MRRRAGRAFVAAVAAALASIPCVALAWLTAWRRTAAQFFTPPEPTLLEAGAARLAGERRVPRRAYGALKGSLARVSRKESPAIERERAQDYAKWHARYGTPFKIPKPVKRR
jgi:hypothetical protein